MKIGNSEIALEDENIRYAECLEIRRLYQNNLHDYLRRRRTNNVGWICTRLLRDISFDDLEKIWKIRFNDGIWEYAKSFGIQLEQCIANDKAFRKNLHNFYVRLVNEICEKNKIGEFAEFMHLLFEEAVRSKLSPLENVKLENIFSAYLSLVEQCYTYFIKNGENTLIGLKSDKSELIEGIDYFPYIDKFQYDEEDILHEYAIVSESGGNISKTLQTKVGKAYLRIAEKFSQIGFPIQSSTELDSLVACANNYSNNLCAMIYYIDENTLDFIPKARGTGATLRLGYVRAWKPSDFYKKELRVRNYTLPSDGVVAEFFFAGAIKKLHLKEVFKDDKIILLWKLEYTANIPFCDGVAVTTGYYDPTNELFFSNFILGKACDDSQDAIKSRDTIENFVLENYYLLTKKEKASDKKYSIMIVNDEKKPIEKIVRWNNQPIVNYMYKTYPHAENDGKKGSKKNQSGDYFKETISLSCTIRKLPDGWKASDEAKENAIKYGYDLEEGYTFVLPFQRQQRRLKGTGIILH